MPVWPKSDFSELILKSQQYYLEREREGAQKWMFPGSLTVVFCVYNYVNFFNSVIDAVIVRLKLSERQMVPLPTECSNVILPLSGVIMTLIANKLMEKS